MSTKLEETLMDLNTECESLKSQLTHSKKEIEIHKSKNLALNETNEDLTNQNTSLGDKVQQLTTQLNALKDINSTFDELTSKNDSFKKNIKNLEQNIKHYESENKQLKQQLEEYKLKLSQNDRSNENKKVIIDSHKQTESKQSVKIEELEDKIQILETELSQQTYPHLEEDMKLHIPSPLPGYLPSLNDRKTLNIKSSENIAQVTNTILTTNVSSKSEIILTPNAFSDKFSHLITVTGTSLDMYTNPSMISTASANDGTIMAGYDMAALLQQKEIECKELLEKKEQSDKEIIRLKKQYDKNSLTNDYNKLKRENRILKQTLQKSYCSMGCFSSSWFKDKVENE
eukprot:66019_1